MNVPRNTDFVLWVEQGEHQGAWAAAGAGNISDGYDSSDDGDSAKSWNSTDELSSDEGQSIRSRWSKECPFVV